MARVSLPKEHGAYLTLAGGAVAAGLAAPHPLPALGTGLAMTAAFVAHAALDRAAAGARLRAWDGAALAGLAAMAALGVWLAAGVSRTAAAVALASALAIALASAVARWTRLHRHAAFELCAMGAIGASSGAGALAGGAGWRVAAPLALVLAAHAMAAVPLVRTELRRQGRSARHRAIAGSLAIVAGAALVLLPSRPALALALIPRALLAAQLALARREPRPPAVIGVLETLALAAAVTIATLVP